MLRSAKTFYPWRFPSDRHEPFIAPVPVPHICYNFALFKSLKIYYLKIIPSAFSTPKPERVLARYLQIFESVDKGKLLAYLTTFNGFYSGFELPVTQYFNNQETQGLKPLSPRGKMGKALEKGDLASNFKRAICMRP